MIVTNISKEILNITGSKNVMRKPVDFKPVKDIKLPILNISQYFPLHEKAVYAMQNFAIVENNNLGCLTRGLRESDEKRKYILSGHYDIFHAKDFVGAIGSPLSGALYALNIKFDKNNASVPMIFDNSFFSDEKTPVTFLAGHMWCELKNINPPKLATASFMGVLDESLRENLCRLSKEIESEARIFNVDRFSSSSLYDLLGMIRVADIPVTGGLIPEARFTIKVQGRTYKEAKDDLKKIKEILPKN